MPQGDDFTDSTPALPVDPTPAPAAPAPDASDDAAPAAVDPRAEPQASPDATPDAAQRRRDAAFAQMRRENQALQARLTALEAAARGNERSPDGRSAAPAPPSVSTANAPVGSPQGVPQPEAYGTHAEYVQAVSQWAVDQNEQRKAQQAAQDALTTAWDKQEAEAKAKYDDYDEALTADTTRYHPAVLHAIQTSEHGAEVAYHLATHPEEAQRIAALPPAAAVRALGRLEATLETRTASTASGAAHGGGTTAPAQSQPSAGPVQQPTPKPRPLTPVGGAGTGGSAVSPDAMDFDAYTAWYSKTFGSR